MPVNYSFAREQASLLDLKQARSFLPDKVEIMLLCQRKSHKVLSSLFVAVAIAIAVSPSTWGTDTTSSDLSRRGNRISIPRFAGRDFLAGRQPTFLATSDLNGDRKPDLVVTNILPNGNGAVSVLLNTTPSQATSPSFSTPTTFSLDNTPISVAIADINQDHKPDLIVTMTTGVSVLINTTPAGASVPSFVIQKTLTNLVPYAVTTADLNGDGKTDLIITEPLYRKIDLFLNDTAADSGAPTFLAPQSFFTADTCDQKATYCQCNTFKEPVCIGGLAESVAAVDINADGRPDLIVTYTADQTVGVRLNTTPSGATTFSFTPQKVFMTGTGPSSVKYSATNSLAIADLNGDGKPDLIVANFNDNSISILLNTTMKGALIPSFTSQQTFAAGEWPTSVAVSDVNGDGRPDVIVAAGGGKNVSILLNTTATNSLRADFALRPVFSHFSLANSVATADINGDGKPDIVVADSSPQRPVVSVLLNTTEFTSK